MENTQNKTQLLIQAIQEGLPLVSRPYADLGRRIGLTEAEVITKLTELLANGTIKRLGVVVRHCKLGYQANAMIVWDVPEEQVTQLGQCLGRFDFVTLCYRRPRHLPEWPYNLFCMIHGQTRKTVMAQVDWLIDNCGLHPIPHEILFSTRCFKQRGAVYKPRDIITSRKLVSLPGKVKDYY